MLRFNPSVHVNYFHRRLSDVFEYASIWSLRAREDVYVTSIDDKVHSAGSLHGDSLAIDLSVAGNAMPQLERLHRFLARYLPPEYDVLLERDHVHVEWDTKRRLAPGEPHRPPTPATPA